MPRRRSLEADLVPLQELNRDPARLEDSGSEVGFDNYPRPLRLRRVFNFARFNIRNAVTGVLGRIPIPQSQPIRRWGYAIAGAILIALVVTLAWIFIPRRPPIRFAPDPSVGWEKGLDPNGRMAYRLPSFLEPMHYRLHLNFHIHNANRRFEYEGRVAIIVRMSESVDAVTKFLIHAHKSLDVDFNNLIVTEQLSHIIQLADNWTTFPYIDEHRKLNSRDEDFRPWSFKWNQFGEYQVPNVSRIDDDTLEVTLQRPLDKETGARKIVLLHFKGLLRHRPPGLFAQKVQDSEEYWVATQFQPTLARAAFPCFDEPRFRAPFALSVSHPSKYVALSNMMVTVGSTQRLVGKEDSVWTTFENTQMMPTYLFGFVFGPFKSLTLTQLRDVTNAVIYGLDRNDLLHRSGFAIDVAVKALSFAADYFQMRFGGKTLSIVAVPTSQPIDIESWGLLLFREESVFMNMTTASVDMLESVARKVVHYVIHQWVGNIVGPSTWEGLWATEALIRFIEDDFLEEIFPDWHVKENFAHKVSRALNVDAMEDTHPVAALPRIPHYPVTMFDALTSIKGAAIFRMVELHSPGSMKTAIRQYLKYRKLIDVDDSTLFDRINNAVYLSKYPKASPSEPSMVDVLWKWTRKTGFPLVSVIRHKDSSDLSIYQELFVPLSMTRKSALNTSSYEYKCTVMKEVHHRSQPSEDVWSIPVKILWKDKETEVKHTREFWVTTETHRMCSNMPPLTTYIVANYNQTGFFRVNYDDADWLLLGHQFFRDPAVLSKVTRAQLIDDAMMMGKVGRVSFVEALAVPTALLFVRVRENMTAADVGMIDRGMRAVADINDCVRGSDVQKGMLEYMGLLAASIWQGVDPINGRRNIRRANGSIDIVAQRTALLLQDQALFWACYTGIDECRQWTEAFAKHWEGPYTADENATEDQYYSSAYCAAVRFGTDLTFDYLWRRYNDADITDRHKREILWSLLCTTRKYKISDVLGKLAGNQKLADDAMLLWGMMEGRHISAWYAFKYELSPWENIHHRLYNTSLFNQMIVAITGAVSTVADVEMIKSFRLVHRVEMLDIKELLDVNVLKIHTRWHFRTTIEHSLKQGLEKVMPFAKAIKIFESDLRSQTPVLPYYLQDPAPIPAPPFAE